MPEGEGIAEVDLEKRARAVDALAREDNVSAAARASGYSRVHVQRLRKDAAFLAEVERRRAQTSAVAANAPPAPSAPRLAELERRALDFLDAVVAGEAEAVDDVPMGQRVQAAKALATHAATERARARPGAPATDSTVTGTPAASPPPTAVEAPATGAPALRVLDPLSAEAKADADRWLEGRA